MSLDSAVFWSYAHDDNEFDAGRILDLARDLRREYALITGEDLSLFVDRSGIQWGDEWRQRIDSALVSSTFFLPIITPRYFTRPECRRELLEFYGQVEGRGLARLIMPIRYVAVQDLTAENRDEAVALISRLQYVDWTNLRLADISSEEYRQAVNGLARRLAELGREIAAEQLEQEASAADADEDSQEAPGLLDLRERIAALLPAWLDAVEHDQVTFAQFTALSDHYDSKRKRLRAAGAPHSQILALDLAEARDELPLAESRLNDAKKYSALTIELHPLIVEFLRELRMRGADASLADEIRDAAFEARAAIALGERRSQEPGSLDSEVYWSQRRYMGRSMRKLGKMYQESNRFTREANALVEVWVGLLSDLDGGDEG